MSLLHFPLGIFTNLLAPPPATLRALPHSLRQLALWGLVLAAVVQQQLPVRPTSDWAGHVCGTFRSATLSSVARSHPHQDTVSAKARLSSRRDQPQTTSAGRQHQGEKGELTIGPQAALELRCHQSQGPRLGTAYVTSPLLECPSLHRYPCWQPRLPVTGTWFK